MFLTYDIVVLEGLDSELFSDTYLSKILVVEDSRFEMSADDVFSKRKITSTIKMRLSRLREDSQFEIIYKLRTGDEEPEKMLEIVTNQNRWLREAVLDWVEKIRRRNPLQIWWDSFRFVTIEKNWKNNYEIRVQFL